MRRYTTFPPQIAPVGKYLNKGGIIIDGTIPCDGLWEQVHFLERFERPGQPAFVHFSLSLPAGRDLTNQQWGWVITKVLEASGVPRLMTPWFAIGREPSRCSHIHIVSALRTFDGRELEIRTSPAATNDLHRDLCHHLDLPEPKIIDDPSKCLAPDTNLRCAGTAKSSLACALNQAFRNHKPGTLDQLNMALSKGESDWHLVRDVEQPNHLWAISEFHGARLNPMSLGSAYKSSVIRKRLRFARRLRLTGLYLSVARVLRALSSKTLSKLVNQGTSQYDTSRHITRDTPQDRRSPNGRATSASTHGVAGSGQADPSRRSDRAFVGKAGSDQRGAKPDADLRDATHDQNGATGGQSGQDGANFRHGSRRPFGNALARVIAAIRSWPRKCRWRASAQGQIFVFGKEGQVIQIDCRSCQIHFEGRSAEYLAAYLDEALDWQVFGSDIEHLMWLGDDEYNSGEPLEVTTDDSEIGGPEM
jgi:hypothetical protein